MNDFSMEKSKNTAPVAISGETREVAEVKAQIFLARQFPRDVEDVKTRIMAECQNVKLAEAAQYVFKRGDSEVKGASIRLMETIVRAWGNCDSSITEVERRATGSTVKARFWDFETNSQHSKIFDVDFVRNTKKGSYQVTDERDKYEMMASYGARRLRACMQAGIPSYIVDMAVEACDKTLADSMKGDSIETLREKMLEAFKKIVEWVTPEMLSTVVGKDFEHITTQDLVKLRSLYNAIKDGFVKPEVAFGKETDGLPSVEEQNAADELNEQLGIK